MASLFDWLAKRFKPDSPLERVKKWHKRHPGKPFTAITGVTIDFLANPVLELRVGDKTGRIFPAALTEKWHPNGYGSWPVNPATGERVPLKCDEEIPF